MVTKVDTSSRTYAVAMTARDASGDPRRARTVDALLRAGERLFSDRPLDDVTVEDIAATAGVAVGSLYNHFGSKAGLYAAVVQHALDADRAHMDQAYVPGRSPREQLEAAAEEYLAFYLEHPAYFRMLAAPGTRGSYTAGDHVADELADAVVAQNERLVAALEAGTSSGVLRDIDARAVATVLWASWNGIISLGWRPDRLARDAGELRGLLSTAVDVVTNGLLKDAE